MRSPATRILGPLVALAVASLWSSEALGAPAWGSNCLSCHGAWQPEIAVVFGEDTTANPNESLTGAPDRGVLKAFEVPAGETKLLRLEVVGLSAGDRYAVTLKRFRFPGVERGGSLAFAGDCEWAEWKEPGDHFSQPAVSHRWGEGPTTFEFEISVAPDAGYDHYDLVFAAAGRTQDGILFNSEEHFYLHVLPRLGDLDADGDVDLVDFEAWQACLNGPEGPEPSAECAPATFDSADLDGDSDVDLRDFAIFAEKLSH